ncbi:hypothetical protein FXO38_17978 [Capsicum annuum]|nr:hypothetical protein FXO38_17978 [Capsicum annuum]
MCRKGDMRYVDCIWVDEPPMGPTSGSFSSVGDVPLVYILYALFTTLLDRPMMPTEYKWTVLMPTAPFRYAEILEDIEKDPESHGGPPDCILLCRLREQVLREVGFRDIFKKVKDEENAKAISLFKDVVCLNDAIEDEAKRVENLVRGIFAGNIFDLGSAKAHPKSLFTDVGPPYYIVHAPVNELTSPGRAGSVKYLTSEKGWVIGLSIWTWVILPS